MIKYFNLFLFLFFSISAYANEIPEFTPNVVDHFHYLNLEETELVNANLQKLKTQNDIWGAVYIVDQLSDTTIEELAEKAFSKWKLGEKGKDNGLLLVLSMKDRQSRFEVGYGLEGSLPDVITRRALDHVLAPRMKKRRTLNAINDSFNYLAEYKLNGQKSADKFFNARSKSVDINFSLNAMNSNTIHAIINWGVFVVLLFFLKPFIHFRIRKFAFKIANTFPEYDMTKDKELNKSSFLSQIFSALFLKIFLMINPGVFILILSSIDNVISYFILALIGFISFLIYYSNVKHYRTPEAFSAFVEMKRKLWAPFIKNGYVKETSMGFFEFTTAYYESDEYKNRKLNINLNQFSSGSSRSSWSSGGSSSRSSSSSSSGGGRSGGGGSSSSW